MQIMGCHRQGGRPMMRIDWRDLLAGICMVAFVYLLARGWLL